MTKSLRAGEDITERPDSPTASPAVSHAQHTPLPWTTMGVSNPHTDPRMSLWGPRPQGSESGEWIAKDLTPANVAFVLRAVNHHEALLAVARRFVEMYDNVRDHVGPSVREALTQADRAIANAEGK